MDRNKALANSIWLLSEVLTSHLEECLCVLHWTFYRLKRCTEWRAEKVHVNILISSLGGNNGHASLLHVTVCEMSVKMCCFAGLSECAMNTSCSVALKKMEKKNMTGTTRHQVISCFSGALFVLEIQQNLKQALSDLSEKASKTFPSKEDKGRMDLAVFWEVFPFYNLI